MFQISDEKHMNIDNKDIILNLTMTAKEMREMRIYLCRIIARQLVLHVIPLLPVVNIQLTNSQCLLIYIISRADPSMDTVQISYQCLNVKNSKTNMFRVNSVNNQLYFIKSIIESYRDSS